MNVHTATCGPICVCCFGFFAKWIDPDPFGLAVGASGQVRALVMYSDESTGDHTNDSNWSSADTSIATVQTQGQSNPGMETGLSVGSVNISASFEDIREGRQCVNFGICVAAVFVAPGGTNVKTCSITVKFTGSKSAGNGLLFNSGDETLGLKNFSDGWAWQVEVSGTVSDDASTWTLAQSFTGRRKRVQQTSDGTLLPEEDTPLDEPNDNPDALSRQQPTGQTRFFWIDGPGHLKTLPLGGNNVYSLTQVQNFTSTVRKGSNSCSVNWFLKLVVLPGGVLDTTNTQVGFGSASTNF